MTPIKGPAELVLAASIARRHYVDGRSKIEIAEEFRLSRFKVARLLEAAREHGLVRIEIGHWGTIDVVSSGRLVERFGLRHAIVVDTPDDDLVSLRRNLGTAAADLLSEIVTPSDVIGLAWARSVQATVAELKRLPAVPVVQLTGALTSLHDTSSSLDGNSSLDIVREVARTSGGPAYVFFAPFLVTDPAAARALRKQPDVARAFDKISSVTVAVVGIGHWVPGQSTLYDTATEREQTRLRRERVCAEMAGVFLTADGRILQTALNDRMIAISGAQLRSVTQVIAIPYGVAKAPAVRAALLSGLVDTVVTHVSLAEALLADSDQSPREPR
jgi:DNA-binding transcriptional regulator LsrR (DeoR family)